VNPSAIVASWCLTIVIGAITLWITTMIILHVLARASELIGLLRYRSKPHE